MHIPSSCRIGRRGLLALKGFSVLNVKEPKMSVPNRIHLDCCFSVFFSWGTFQDLIFEGKVPGQGKWSLGKVDVIWMVPTKALKWAWDL